jgi:hypothetical protein
VRDHVVMTTDPLEALRRLCLALPEVTERLSHGDRLAFWCAAQPGVQEALVADAYHVVAPRRLVAGLDAGGGQRDGA